ncbi:hypothetical protein Ddye_029234 [Dipteronia dyeriana]|uniref:Uncharacterized protein n=1 Tax=Dipteronia dyeriana TaxID=168575 RepID=A0AAD9WLA6_9ROSI|nr:hypothetical protein Ddye_029234 [Dipteronia dyeriana]
MLERLLKKRIKAGMISAAESITESLRRTRQLMVQRHVSAAIKAGMVGRPEIGRGAVKDGINAAAQVYHDNAVPHAEVPILERPMHDEL